MYGLKKRSKQDENGLIQGAGTGTSDDVKKMCQQGVILCLRIVRHSLVLEISKI